MKRLLRGLLAGLLVLGLVLGGIGCGGGEEATPTPEGTPTPQVKYVKMGGTLPLTGVGAYLGSSVRKTVDLIIKEFNEAGGIVIDGVTYLINMTWYDDAYDPVKGRTNVEKLVYQDKVDYLVALFGSTFAASSSIPVENKVLVTTTSTGGEEVISPEKRYIFRPYTGATVGAYSIMNWLIENYGIERFAFLQIETKSAIDITEFYKSVCAELGVATSIIYYPIFTTDFYPVLTRLLADDPDLLFVGPEALKQARQLGYTGMVTGMLTASDIAAVVRAAGVENAEGYLMSQNLDWKATTEATEFHDKYVEEYGEYDEQALTWVGLIVTILQGIEKANSVDPTDVMLALDQMAANNEPIHLPIGDAYWAGAQRYGGLNHQLVMPIYMMDIHDGEARLLEVLPPPSEEELVPLD